MRGIYPCPVNDAGQDRNERFSSNGSIGYQSYLYMPAIIASGYVDKTLWLYARSQEISPPPITSFRKYH
jgi:hypothetical protein